jgi:hypothetical protein
MRLAEIQLLYGVREEIQRLCPHTHTTMKRSQENVEESTLTLGRSNAQGTKELGRCPRSMVKKGFQEERNYQVI